MRLLTWTCLILLLCAASAGAQTTCRIDLASLIGSKVLTGPAAVGTTVTIRATPTCDLDQVTYTVKDAGGTTVSTVPHSRKTTPTDPDTFTFASPNDRTGAQTYSIHASGNPFGCLICTPAVGDSTLTFFAATGVSPTSGSVVGGNSVGIPGINFPTSGCTVTFGANNAPVGPATSTLLTVTAPAAAGFTPGAVSVKVKCNDTESTAGNYTYTAATPTLTGISPNSGLLAGGNTVTLTGTDFTSLACTKVTFGTVQVTATVVNDKTITAVVPKGNALGAVDVALNCVSTVLTNGYTYGVTIAPITPSPIIPNSVVTIKGTGLNESCSVFFGPTKVTGLKAVSGTTDTFTVTAPANPNTNPANPVGDSLVLVVVSCGGVSADRTQGTPQQVKYAAAAFTFAPQSSPNIIRFTSLSPGSPALSWSFGDNSSGDTLSTVTHTYPGPGQYTVTLTATYPQNVVTTSTRTITVVDPTATFVPRLIVPGQGRAASSLGFFKSQFWATNRTDGPLVVQFRFVPADSTDAPTVAAVTIPQNASLAYSDILWQALGRESGIGNIIVETTSDSAVPLVSARTYAESSFANQASVGNSGQFIPSFAVGADYPVRAMLSGLAPATASRSNVGIVNLSDGDVTFRLELFKEDGSSVGTSIDRTVHAMSMTQSVVEVFFPGATLPPSFSIVITPNTPAKFFAFLSKLDNVTQDPIFVPSTLPARNEQWIHPIGAAPGSLATFNTSLLFAQPDASAAVRIVDTSIGDDSIELLPSGSSGLIDLTTLPELKRVFDVTNASKFYAQVFDQAFSNIAKGAFYVMHVTSKSPLVAWARLFGTLLADPVQNFGQFAPAFGRADLIGVPGAVLQGITQDGSSYTNFAFINVGQTDATMTATLFDTTGTVIGGPIDIPVPAGRATPFQPVDTVFPKVSVTGGYLLVVPKGDAAEPTVYAWASVNDRTSTDSIYVRPQQLPPVH